MTTFSNRPTSIITTSGTLNLKRKMLYSNENKTSIYPMDEFIEISGLPFKITKRMMVETAFYAQNESSFEKGSDMIKKAMDIEINTETVRKVANHVGDKVYETDEKHAKNTYEKLVAIQAESCTVNLRLYPRRTIYLMIDGAAINTRNKDENGSSWRENKLVLCFNEQDMKARKNKSNDILKKEYISFIGSGAEFKKFVFDIAVKAGYGGGDEIVIISDGATWIRNMCEELFPNGLQILDKYHLCKNIYTYYKSIFSNNIAQYTKASEVLIDKIMNGKIEEAMNLLPEKSERKQGFRI